MNDNIEPVTGKARNTAYELGAPAIPDADRPPLADAIETEVYTQRRDNSTAGCGPHKSRWVLLMARALVLVAVGAPVREMKVDTNLPGLTPPMPADRSPISAGR